MDARERAENEPFAVFSWFLENAGWVLTESLALYLPITIVLERLLYSPRELMATLLVYSFLLNEPDNVSELIAPVFNSQMQWRRPWRHEVVAIVAWFTIFVRYLHLGHQREVTGSICHAPPSRNHLEAELERSEAQRRRDRQSYPGYLDRLRARLGLPTSADAAARNSEIRGENIPLSNLVAGGGPDTGASEA